MRRTWDFSATHKHIGENAYARRQATNKQLKDAADYLTKEGMIEKAALVIAELSTR
jgi:hypothetical protein